MENSTKIIETINKYFPKKEVFTEISGLEILDNICKRYDVKGASCKLYSAKYSVSFSQNQRTTFLYCVEIEGQEEKFYFERFHGKALLNTHKNMGCQKWQPSILK